MASLRKLPSGSWQASVLLDNGKRVTSTAPTYDQVQAWAVEMEDKRDAERHARRDQTAEQLIAVHLSSLTQYAQTGTLSAKHVDELRRIIAIASAQRVAETGP